VQTDRSHLIFDVPDGSLRFAPDDLDVWAEHLTWCYRMMGIDDGATIAVHDYGSSPLSFLGSSLLMPGLGRGVAERMNGRFLCLDASTERITLTAALLEQLAVDVIVFRAEIGDLLVETTRRTGMSLDPTLLTVAAFRDDEPIALRSRPWRHLLHVEPALLIAPECSLCGAFHLRHGFYQIENEVVKNLKLKSASSHQFADCDTDPPGYCAASADDWCVRFPQLEYGE
jgi:hypothetical protein